MKNAICDIIYCADKLDEQGANEEATILTAAADKLSRVYSRIMANPNWWEKATEHLQRTASTAEIAPDKEEFEDIVDVLGTLINGVKVAGDIDAYYGFRKEAEDILTQDWRGRFPPYRTMVAQIKELAPKVIEYIDTNKLVKEG
jgi:hypothetical protein